MENISNLKEQTKNELKMKEIIYLDKNIIHSFLAQIEDGLRTSINRESSEEIKSGAESEEGYKRGNSFEGIFNTGKFSIPAIFETPSGNMKIRIQPGAFESEKTSIYQTEFGKEIITRQLHDNALIQFEKYMDDNNLIKQQPEIYKIGDYIKIESNFKVFDIEFFSKLVNPKIISKFTVMEQTAKIDNLKEEIELMVRTKKISKNEADIKKKQLNQQNKHIEGEQKKLEKEITDIQELVIYLREILSNSTFITAENFIIPLKQEYLRETPYDLMFKYSELETGLKISIVGKITRQIKNKEKYDDTFSIHKLASMTENVLVNLGIAKKRRLYCVAYRGLF